MDAIRESRQSVPVEPVEPGGTPNGCDTRVASVCPCGTVQGQEIVFQSADSVLSPDGVGQGLDQLVFSCALGVVLGYETLDVLLIGFEVVRREDDGLAGEPMA